MWAAIPAIISLVTTLIGLIKDGVSWLSAYLTKKHQTEKIDEIKKAVDEATHAETPEEKADAACKLEKAFNPDSTCDSGASAR